MWVTTTRFLGDVGFLFSVNAVYGGNSKATPRDAMAVRDARCGGVHGMESVYGLRGAITPAAHQRHDPNNKANGNKMETKDGRVSPRTRVGP